MQPNHAAWCNDHLGNICVSEEAVLPGTDVAVWLKQPVGDAEPTLVVDGNVGSVQVIGPGSG